MIARRPGRRGAVVVGTLLGLAALAAPELNRPAPRLLWNASASLPIGLYRVDSGRRAGLGRAVVYRPTAAHARLLAARGYLPENVPLLKPVAAAAPSVVCRRGLDVFIDGRLAARARPADRAGRVLPAWSGCRRLGAAEVFLLAPAAPDSFDSRYIGPVLQARIVGPATPLWLPGAPQ